jgi:hypothetical protein
MCFSNEQDCLHISKSARRYGVINLYDRLTISQLKKWEADGTFKKIYDFIQSDKIKHLFHYFLYEVKIKDWKLFNRGRAPETDALKVMQEEAQHPTIQKLDRALKQNLAPFDRSFPGFVILDDLLDFIREKWKTQINEKWVKDWLKEIGFKWNNGKQTRQILIPQTGERPRAWLLENSDHLKSLDQTALGSAPTMCAYTFNQVKLKHSLETESWEGYKKSNVSPKQIIVENIKIIFGNRWTNPMELRFYESLLRIAIHKNKTAEAILKKYKLKKTYAGEEDNFNYEKYLEAIKELDNATQEEKKKLLKKYNTSKLPSDILFEKDRNEE